MVLIFNISLGIAASEDNRTEISESTKKRKISEPTQTSIQEKGEDVEQGHSKKAKKSPITTKVENTKNESMENRDELERKQAFRTATLVWHFCLCHGWMLIHLVIRSVYVANLKLVFSYDVIHVLLGFIQNVLVSRTKYGKSEHVCFLFWPILLHFRLGQNLHGFVKTASRKAHSLHHLTRMMMTTPSSGRSQKMLLFVVCLMCVHFTLIAFLMSDPLHKSPPVETYFG